MKRLPQLLVGMALTALFALMLLPLTQDNLLSVGPAVLSSKATAASHDWDTKRFTDRPLDRNLYHLINQRTIFSGSGCTATAIGPHALLTATHCESATQDLVMDGFPVHIDSVLRDEHDHSIYLVSNVTFSAIGKVDPNHLYRGEAVHFFGIASGADPLRRGRFKHYVPQHIYYDLGWGWSSLHDHRDLEIFNLMGIPGDSGSGLINDEGMIVAVLSASDGQGEVLCFPLTFTDVQWKEAQNYAPPATDSKTLVPIGHGVIVSVTEPSHPAVTDHSPASGEAHERHGHNHARHGRGRKGHSAAR